MPKSQNISMRVAPEWWDAVQQAADRVGGAMDLSPGVVSRSAFLHMAAVEYMKAQGWADLVEAAKSGD